MQSTTAPTAVAQSSENNGVLNISKKIKVGTKKPNSNWSRTIVQTSVFTVEKMVSTCFSLHVGGVGGSGHLVWVFGDGSAAREEKTKL